MTIEFRLIDFQTYTAIQEAPTVLEKAAKQPASVSKLGGGLGLMYAARLREIAETDVASPNTGVVDDEKIKATAEQLTPLIRFLCWTSNVQYTVAEVADRQVSEAIGALRRVRTVALDQPDMEER